MSVAEIKTHSETFTIFISRLGYQGISNLGTKTPVFKSFERLQDFLTRNSRIQKIKTRV